MIQTVLLSMLLSTRVTKYNYTKVVTIDTDRISIIFYTVRVYKDVQFMFISNYKNVHATADKMMNKVGT